MELSQPHEVTDPFADGNGRTMRLMQQLLLLKGGDEIARFVPSETAIMATRALGTLNPILEYLAECFAISAENVINDGRKFVKQRSAARKKNSTSKML